MVWHRGRKAKKASGVRGRRVRTAVRESAPQVLGTEDEKLPRQESPTTRDRTKLTKRTCRSRPLQCCPGANRPSPKAELFFLLSQRTPLLPPPALKGRERTTAFCQVSSVWGWPRRRVLSLRASVFGHLEESERGGRRRKRRRFLPIERL